MSSINQNDEMLKTQSDSVVCHGEDDVDGFIFSRHSDLVAVVAQCRYNFVLSEAETSETSSKKKY